jgi:hypothetical protein
MFVEQSLFSLFVCSESYGERISRCQTSIFVKLSVLEVNQSLEAVCYDNYCFIVPSLPVAFKLLSQTQSHSNSQFVSVLASTYGSRQLSMLDLSVTIRSFSPVPARATLVAGSKYFFLRKKLIRHYLRALLVCFLKVIKIYDSVIYMPN